MTENTKYVLFYLSMILIITCLSLAVDNLIIDPIVEASKTMTEVQTVIEPEPDIYTRLDFAIEKLSIIESCLYEKKIFSWNDARALQEIDQRWLKYQCAKLAKEIEKEMRKEE